MSDRHLEFWPDQVPRQLTVPETNLFYNAEVSAARYPNKTFMVFYDSKITFSRFKREAEILAGYLEHECGVKKGDRVLLFMQNSPQFIIGYYAILRANAVVVPLNPMNMAAELSHYVNDCGAHVVLVAQELLEQITPLMGRDPSSGLRHGVVCAYSDYIEEPMKVNVPEVFLRSRSEVNGTEFVQWHEVLSKGLQPGPLLAGPDDLCVMPYTSGTTGTAKGCMHTHRTVMTTLVGMEAWFSVKADDVRLSALPFFHVTGMQGGMNSSIFTGSTLVLLPRWDREVAGGLIERYEVTSWTATPTMVFDFLANPSLDKFNLSTLRRINSGGAAMPKTVAQKLLDRNIVIVEGYGLSETIAPTHLNPPHRAKVQCLGIPIFNVDSRVVDPITFKELPPEEVGEIVTRAPQMFLGYWNRPESDAASFVEIDGLQFFRTGDLARADEEGYFFMVDRVKRMINAAGYKVWPAEVESLLYQHAAVQEACVIGATDNRRGETVKALVVLHDGFSKNITEQDIINWARDTMSAYKVPKSVEFVRSLPKLGSGKVDWRALQDEEYRKSTGGESTMIAK